MGILRPFSTLALLATLCGLIPGSALAQTKASPEALRLADELFSIVSKDMLAQLAEQMTDQVWPVLENRLRASVNTDDATLAALRMEFTRIQRASLTELMKDAPPIYARHFTLRELRELIAFYRSPTGEKAQRVLPQITSELSKGMQPRLDDVQRQTADAFAKILRLRGYLK